MGKSERIYVRTSEEKKREWEEISVEEGMEMSRLVHYAMDLYAQSRKSVRTSKEVVRTRGDDEATESDIVRTSVATNTDPVRTKRSWSNLDKDYK